MKFYNIYQPKEGTFFSKVIEGHIMSLLCLKIYFFFGIFNVPNTFSSKLCMNVNIIKTHISKIKFDLKVDAMDRLRDFFTFRPSNRFATLTKGLIDNFFLCFFGHLN